MFYAVYQDPVAGHEQYLRNYPCSEPCILPIYSVHSSWVPQDIDGQQLSDAGSTGFGGRNLELTCPRLYRHDLFEGVGLCREFLCNVQEVLAMAGLPAANK